MPELISKGSILAAWFDYLKKKPSQEMAVEKHFCNKLQIPAQQTIDLLNKKEIPTGPTLLKIGHFLESQNYSIKQLNQRPSIIRIFSKLIIEKLIKIESACYDLSIKRSQKLFSILLGELNADQSTLEVMQILCSDHEQQLQDPIPEPGNTKQIKANSKNQYPSAPPVHQKNEENPNTNQEVIKTLSTLLLAAIPLAAQLDSESSEIRNKFRQKAGPEKIFQLSCLINQY